MIKYLIIHCTGVSYKVNPDQFNQTNSYHKALRNFKSARGLYGGYNYEISMDGTVRQFRNEGEETAAAIGYNKNAIHICLDGDFDIEMPTNSQVLALTKLMIGVQLRHNIPLENIIAHRKVATTNKTCYGSKLSDSWARDLIKNYSGTDLGIREC